MPTCVGLTLTSCEVCFTSAINVWTSHSTCFKTGASDWEKLHPHCRHYCPLAPRL